MKFEVDLDWRNERVLDACRRKWNHDRGTKYSSKQYLSYILNRWFEKKADEWPNEKDDCEDCDKSSPVLPEEQV